MTSAKQSPSRNLFGRGRSEFLRGSRQPVAWRLDVRVDSNDRGMFLPRDDRGCWWGMHRQRRLIGYIAAGGMRDLQPSRHADLDERRRRLFITFALLLLSGWLAFLLLPCN